MPFLRKSWTPCWDGICPVRIEARAGEQTGEAQKKFSNRTPVDAIRSRLGVSSSSLPAQPIAQAPWSSLSMKMILGVCGLLLAKVPPSGARLRPFHILSVVEFLPVKAEVADCGAQGADLQIMATMVWYRSPLTCNCVGPPPMRSAMPLPGNFQAAESS